MADLSLDEEIETQSRLADLNQRQKIKLIKTIKRQVDIDIKTQVLGDRIQQSKQESRGPEENRIKQQYEQMRKPQEREAEEEKNEDKKDNDKVDENEEEQEEEPEEGVEPENLAEAEEGAEATGSGGVAEGAGTELAEGAAEGAAEEGLWAFLAATWEIWVPVLLIIVVVGGLIAIAVFAPVAMCNSNYTDELATGTGKLALTGTGICKQLGINQGGASGGGGGGSGFGYSGGTTDAEIRAYLTGLGIGINNNNCAPGQSTGCTSLDGMKAATVDEIVSIVASCDVATNPGGPPDNACGIKVTGGTEDAHAEGTCSHANGYKVDLSPTTAINNYISNPSLFTPSGTRSDGVRLYKRVSDGAIYADERNMPPPIKPHWDVIAPGCT